MARCSTTGKTKYPNRLEADLAIADIGRAVAHHRKNKNRETPTRSYRCEFCRSWHMTSQDKNQQKE